MTDLYLAHMEFNERSASESPLPDEVSSPRRRRTARIALIGVTAAGVLVFTAAGAWAASDVGNPAPPRDRPAMRQGMDEMHGSREMRRMHADLSPELRAEMHAMHERMTQMNEMGSMMSGEMGSRHGGRDL